MIKTLFLLSVLTVSVYVVMTFRWVIAWMLFPVNRTQGVSTSVSVVVAVRNERSNIKNLLSHLAGQHYDHSRLEVIISDDDSEDDTVEQARQWAASVNPLFRLIILTNNGQEAAGKKAALERAIGLANGSLILTTDADCEFGPEWIQSMADAQSSSGASMVTGFVVLKPEGGMFSYWQSLDFLSLTSSGAASVIIGSPLMCNGANLAFLKSAFEETGGYTHGAEQPSGDDVFLMLSMHRLSPRMVTFCNHPGSVVTTKPAHTLKEFIQQRIRWASKVKHYSGLRIKLTGILVFLTSLFLLLSLILSVMGVLSWPLSITLWLMKGVADFCLLMKGASFARCRLLLWLFLPAFIFQPLYTVMGALLSVLPVQFTWKNRKWKTT